MMYGAPRTRRTTLFDPVPLDPCDGAPRTRTTTLFDAPRTRRTTLFDAPRTRRTTLFDPVPLDPCDPFPLDPWEPFQQFHPLEAPFSLAVPPRPHLMAETVASPLMNTRIERTQTPTAHVFKLDLPGFKREEVTVDLEDGRVLKITGEKCVEKEGRSDRWHRVERGRGRFMTSFVLPENCKPHETEAAMENGVLTIRVPKLEVRNGRGESVRLPVR